MSKQKTDFMISSDRHNIINPTIFFTSMSNSNSSKEESRWKNSSYNSNLKQPVRPSASSFNSRHINHSQPISIASNDRLPSRKFSSGPPAHLRSLLNSFDPLEVNAPDSIDPMSVLPLPQSLLIFFFLIMIHTYTGPSSLSQGPCGLSLSRS